MGWDDYFREVAMVAAELQGAADYFAENPDRATDAVLADCFRRYVERFRAVELPG